MRFLADESCDSAVVRALRDGGEDVLAVAETSPGASDLFVREAARRDDRVLLTEDKDFGNLVFAGGYPTSGVILLRYPIQARSSIAHTVVDLVRQRAHALGGAFVVVEPGRIRIIRASG